MNGIRTSTGVRRRLAVTIAIGVLATACTSTARAPAPTTSPPATSGTLQTPSSQATTSSYATARPSTSAFTIPPVSAIARAEGLLDVRTIVPDAVIDLRYATTNNFTGVQLYPADARCLVHETMAAGLRTAAAQLRREGFVLVFWDCYRPHAVQVRMFQVVPNPNWVARPGPYATSHESARSVDVTLAVADTRRPCVSTRRDHGHCMLHMGTGFDDFTPRAYAYATADVSTQQQADRALLRNAMNAGGLTVYSGEWWHFDGPGAFAHLPILAAPVN